MKFCSIAFVFWLFGGLVGLHHFYLGRDRQGFLWATTFGGFFLGWLKDFSALSRYTEESNTGYPLRAARRPSFWSELHRFLGFVILGYFYRSVFINAIPNDSNFYAHLHFLIAPLGVAFSSYLISNIGHITCSFKYPLIGAYIGEILFGKNHLFLDKPNVLLIVFVSVIFCVVGWRERQRKDSLGYSQRFLLWSLLGLAFLGLWGSFLYHNAEIEINVNGVTSSIKFSKVVKDFFMSPEWKELCEKLKDFFWTLWKTRDLRETWDFMQKDILYSQLKTCLKNLGFNSTVKVEEVSIEEIKKAYKELAKKFHPDKNPNNETAKNMFIEITECHETLLKYKKN